MDFYSVAAAVAGTGLVFGCGAYLYRCIKNVPAGYEDESGFHYGDPAATVDGWTFDGCRTAPAIDWSKPLVLTDGTPVELAPPESLQYWGGTNPDRDGDYWVQLPCGNRECVHPDGRSEETGLPIVRNWVPQPAAANSNLPQLTLDQELVLSVMDSDVGHSAAAISRWTNIPAGRVSEAQRELRKLGLADFGPLFDDDGKLRGRGYWLTPAGNALKVQLMKTVAA